jgi:hypothetical protein
LVAFKLRSPSQVEVDEELEPFELELTALFRAMQVAAVDALRAAAERGATPDEAVTAAGNAAVGRLHADTEAQEG